MAGTTGSLAIELTERRGVRVVVLEGRLDGGLDPQQLRQAIGGTPAPVVIDLHGVVGISSSGVRAWMASLRELARDQYYFVRCRPALVLEMSTVLDFGQRGTLVSLYCPFVCGPCGVELAALVDLRHEAHCVQLARPPYMVCPTCRMPAAFDEDPATYFAFGRELPPLVVSPAVSAVIDEICGGQTRPAPVLRIQKQVDEELTVLTLSGTLDRTARLERLAAGLDGVVVVTASGVTEVNGEGVARLGALLDATRCQLHLVQVSLRLLRFLGSGHHGAWPIASVSVPFECTTCKATYVRSIGPELQGNVAAGQLVESCRRCQELAPVALDRRDRTLIGRLKMIAAPEVVAAYLLRTGAEVPGQVPGRTPRRPTPTVGPETLGRYQLLERIGMGGMAEVFLGRQIGPEGFAKTVVIKRILPRCASDPRFVAMLHEEARLAGRVAHANVVQILDVGVVGDVHYLVMEYVKGWTLDAALRALGRQGRTMPAAIACRIVSDVCAGLWAAHSATDDAGRLLSIVHRDVTPHNVLLSTDGLVKLTDFGVAKAADSLVTTRDGGLKGKVFYMAPELVRGERPDPRADLFAVGLILQYCLTQHHPFEGQSEFQIVSTLLTSPEPIPAATRESAAVPPALQRLLGRALSSRKEDRHASAHDLRQEIESFLRQEREYATAEQLAAFLEELFQPARGPWESRASGLDPGPRGAGLPAPPAEPEQVALDPVHDDVPDDAGGDGQEVTIGNLTLGNVTVGEPTIGNISFASVSLGELPFADLLGRNMADLAAATAQPGEPDVNSTLDDTAGAPADGPPFRRLNLDR